MALYIYPCATNTMDRSDIKSYLDKHCRFRLRSGREVYGVLWEERNEGSLFFSSAGDRKAPSRLDLSDTALSLDPEDIIFAEALHDQMAS